MTQARKDNNRVPTALGVSNADGITPLLLYVDPSTHAIITDDDTTGSDLGPVNAKRDNNGEPVMLGVSNADGVTPVAPYIDSSTNKLLTNSH